MGARQRYRTAVGVTAATILLAMLGLSGVPSTNEELLTSALIAGGAASFLALATPSVVERWPSVHRYSVVALGLVAAGGIAAGVVTELTVALAVIGAAGLLDLTYRRTRPEFGRTDG